MRSGEPVDGRHARGAAPGPGPTRINARALAFVRHVIVRTSERTEPFAWGTACFNDRYRLRWDSNLLLVERRLVGVDADSLARQADLLLASFAHRNLVVFDDADGMRVADGLARLGYERDHLVVMALAGMPDEAPRTITVEEVDLATARPLLVEVNRRGHGGTSEEEAQMLADFRSVLVERIGDRFFVARVDGALAGGCELYVGDGVAQIEDVNTLEEFRGRGIARAALARAIHAAHEGGADLVFLVADADDWPRNLYARMGFEPVGHYWAFTRPPPDRPYR